MTASTIGIERHIGGLIAAPITAMGEGRAAISSCENGSRRSFRPGGGLIHALGCRGDWPVVPICCKPWCAKVIETMIVSGE